MTDGDELISVYVELEDAIRRLRDLKHTVGQMIAEREVTVQKILNAVRESDEHQMRMGMPCTGPIAPGYECLTHTCALDEDDVEMVDRCGE
jgi:hypothetical protein